MAEDFEAVDEFLAGVVASFNSEREDRPGALGRVFLRQFVIRARRQGWKFYPGHQRMLLQVFRGGERVRQVTIHAHTQRFDSLNELECVEWAHARAEVAQSFHAAAND